MTHDHTPTNPEHNPDLHLQDDPELLETESLLDLLARQDADTMPDGLEARVLDSISATIAPPPIAMNRPSESGTPHRLWSLRLAAGLVLATGTTLVIVSARPWAHSQAIPQSDLALVSFEQDLDAFFALESVDDGNLSLALTEWEIWAQSVDTEIDSTLIGLDWDEPISDDGAL